MLENSKGATVLIMEQSVDDTNNQQERLVDLAWLAGIWEGEGCFSIFKGSRNHWYAACSLPNTDYVLIDAIHEALVRHNVGHYIHERKAKNPKWKSQKCVYIVGFKRVRTFVEQILPFIRGRKRKVIEVILRFLDRRQSVFSTHRSHVPYSDADFKDMAEVRALNKKGPQESSETIRQAAQA